MPKVTDFANPAKLSDASEKLQNALSVQPFAWALASRLKRASSVPVPFRPLQMPMPSATAPVDE